LGILPQLHSHSQNYAPVFLCFSGVFSTGQPLTDYPARLKTTILDLENPCYTEGKIHRQFIRTFVKGGSEIREKIRELIPRRVGEAAVIYKERLNKLTYKNIIGTAIRTQSQKLSNGVMSVVFPDADAEFWDEFRENTNGDGRSENDLIIEIFKQLALYQRLWLHIDKTRPAIAPRNRSEELAMNLTPYINVLDSFQVIAWGSSWIKLRQHISNTDDPLSEPVESILWTFIDSEKIVKYNLPIKGKNGDTILDYFTGKRYSGFDHNEQWVDKLGDDIYHGFGCFPVFPIELSAEMWMVSDAVFKANEHLRLSCHRFDLLTAAFFQRSFKRKQPATENLAVYSEEADLELGMEHVLEVESFTWNEPQGTIIERLESTLVTVEQEIKDAISVGGESVQQGTQPSTVQSGAAKLLDFESEISVLEAFGRVITKSIDKAYNLVAIIEGLSEVEVSGLDDFELASLDSLLAQLTLLVAIDLHTLKGQLPILVFEAVYKKLCALLAGDGIKVSIDQMPEKTDPVPIAVAPAKADSVALPQEKTEV
jgi:hypothetical protein